MYILLWDAVVGEILVSITSLRHGDDTQATSSRHRSDTNLTQILHRFYMSILARFMAIFYDVMEWYMLIVR